jgi:CubicO group peptidase (beta-lactamase class C family)
MSRLGLFLYVPEECAIVAPARVQTKEARRRQVTAGGFSSRRLARVRGLLERHVDSGFVPGVLAVLARHGDVHIEATGNLAFEGVGSRTPMASDTICRIASMTKPIVAACAMTLVEDCTLRLDDPVDDLLPELAGVAVLADPEGPLEDTVEAKRPITVRHLLTSTLGTGMVPAEPGTVPIADALDALAHPRRTNGCAGSARSLSCTSQASAGCTTPPPTRRACSSPGPRACLSRMPCASGSAVRSG